MAQFGFSSGFSPKPRMKCGWATNLRWIDGLIERNANAMSRRIANNNQLNKTKSGHHSINQNSQFISAINSIESKKLDSLINLAELNGIHDLI